MNLKLFATVFAASASASASALVLASAIGVLAGSPVAQHVSPKALSYVAGAGFIAIGIWTMVTAGGD